MGQEERNESSLDSEIRLVDPYQSLLVAKSKQFPRGPGSHREEQGLASGHECGEDQ